MLRLFSLNSNVLALVFLFIGTLLSSIAGFATKIVIARNTTPEVFGNYSTILTTITTLAPLCGFGVQQYWLKIFGQHDSYGVVWIKASLLFVIGSTITIFIILLVWFTVTSDSQYLLISSFILSCIIFNTVGAELMNSTLQIESKYGYLSIWQLFQSSFLLMAIILTIFAFNIPLTELMISSIQSGISIIVALAIIPFIIRFIKNQYKQTKTVELIEYQQKFSPKIMKIMKESAPFGVAGLFYLLYYQFGIIFVRQMLGAKEAGFYGVAFTFLSASLIIPSVIYQKFLLPKLHRWAYHDRGKLIRSYQYGNYIMLALGGVSFIFLWLLAPYIVPIFFGAEYHDSIRIVQMMAINIPIVYVTSNIGSLLITHSYMKYKTFFMGIVAIISLGLTPTLILFFGIVGAVYASFISNLLLLLLFFIFYKKKVYRDMFNGN